MADLFKTMKGIGMFFAGYAGAYVLFFLMTFILDLFETPVNPADLVSYAANGYVGQAGADFTLWVQGAFWFATIVIWVLAMIVIPMVFVVDGINTKDQTKGFLNTVQAVVFVIFSIPITIYVWPFLVNMATILVDVDGNAIALLQGIYWVGLTLTWIGVVIIAPINKIMYAQE